MKQQRAAVKRGAIFVGVWIAAAAGGVGAVVSLMAPAGAWAQATASGGAAGGASADVSAPSGAMLGGETLARRAMLGLRVEGLPGELAGKGGVRVAGVAPGGTAASAGLTAGDTLLRLAGKATDTAETIGQIVRTLRVGEPVVFEVVRQGEPKRLEAKVIEVPRESLAHSTTDYAAVKVEVTGQKPFALRTIITTPKASAIASPDGRFPAVVYMQGIYCQSLDGPAAAALPETLLVHQLAEAGFVTVRVDKPGMGDSAGPDCRDIDFATELAGYVAAAKATTGLKQVDPQRVFLVGYSMGGVMAPYVAQQVPVRGAAVYGTMVRTWFEYVLDNERRQSLLFEAPAAAINERIARTTRVQAMVLLQGKTFGDVWKEFPELREQQPMMDEVRQWGRHLSFFRGLQGLNLAEAWGEAPTKVLAIHGEYDWVSPEDDHKQIAEIANAQRGPGSGTFVSIKGHDHAMQAHENLRASVGPLGRGRPTDAVSKAIVEWIAGLEGRGEKKW
jgi:pimeloyl-ACP methyl ester carboxylesterase